MTKNVTMFCILVFANICMASDYRSYSYRYGSRTAVRPNITSSRPNSYRSSDYYSSGRLSVRGIGTSNRNYYINRR